MKSKIKMLTFRMFPALLLSSILFSNIGLAETPWQPVAGKISTKWAENVTPDNAWREYPRPQMERTNWQCLNGLWDYAITAKDAPQPSAWQGKILVPFGVEASLSGVGKELKGDQALWYQRTFEIKEHSAARTLINFEAVDYHATVSVNGHAVGEHIGGSTAFSFDITDALKAGENQIVVRVLDPMDDAQLRGKQSLHPHGIWYTNDSGIWQTVWIEQVPARHIADLKTGTTTEPAAISITAEIQGTAPAGEKMRVTALLGGVKTASAEGTGKLKLEIPNAKLWSPAHPNLYDLQVELLDSKGAVVDTVKSYAGIRQVGTAKDAQGNLRFTLNGAQIFHWGTLDQGWWPDGLLTPPSDAGMRSDIDFLKHAGFNMIRKHIKVEPRRYYYYCDQIGMLVWQDQILGGKHPDWTHLKPNPVDAVWTDADHAQYMAELKAMMDELHNHPCIAVWTPFNERWGQHRSVEVGQWVQTYDPSRLLNIASGGNFWPVGQIVDNHHYPDPGFPLDDSRFADYVKVVGEFGGHGLLEQGHIWNSESRNFGYGTLAADESEYAARLGKSLDILADLKTKGLSGAVYTQTTDVEGELNGLMTYDRKVMKISPEKLSELSQKLTGEKNPNSN